MQTHSKILLLLLLFCGVRAGSRAQSMVPLIQQTKSVISQIEKDGDVVDVALYDYIFRDNNSSYTYEYQFYSNDSYTIRLIGDGQRNSNFMIRVYRYLGSSWTLVVQTTTSDRSGTELSFRPPNSERYRVEVSGTLTGSYTSSWFALLIVRAEP